MAGTNKTIDSTVLIPASAIIGNRNVRATAAWEYGNSSGDIHGQSYCRKRHRHGFQDHRLTILQLRNDNVDWARRRWSGRCFDCTSSV